MQPGQRVDIGSRTFQTLEFEITGDTYGKLPGYKGLTSVGLAQLGIPGVREQDVIRVPTALLDATGGDLSSHRVTVVLTRLRSDPAARGRSDEELSIERAFSLPGPATFTVSGEARLDGRAPDARLDATLGAVGPLTATSTGRLLGSPASRAAAAVDGDPTTRWVTPMEDVVGQSLTITSPTAVSFDHLDLHVVADGRFSVPTRLTIRADGGRPVTADVPAIADDTSKEGATASVRVPLPTTVTGRAITVTVAALREVKQTDYFSGLPLLQPAAIAELGIPVHQASPNRPLPTACRDDLVSVDGKPVSVRIEGSTAQALQRQPLTVVACGPPLALGPGNHEVRTAVGRDLGLDVDRLVLDTSPASRVAPAPGPALTIEHQDATSARVRVDRATAPFWLVLGESQNAGWHAEIDGSHRELGPPLLVDGYANGWLVTPTGGPLTITLRWTPQGQVRTALVISAGAVVLCLVLVALDPGRRRRRRYPGAAWTAPVPAPVRAPSASPLGHGRRLLAVPLAAAVVFWFLAGPVPAVVAAVVGGLSLVSWRWRRWLRWLPGVVLAGTVAYIVAKLVRYDLPATIDWPNEFEAVNAWAWAAVAAAVMSAVVDWLRPGPVPASETVTSGAGATGGEAASAAP